MALPSTSSTSSTPGTLGTLVDVLGDHARTRGDKLAFAFLKDGSEVGATLTFAELDTQARILGATLQQLTRPGDRALLLYPPGLDFVVAFMGCQYAGVTAIPALPPNLSRVQATLGRLTRIVEDAQPSVVLTTGQLLPRLRGATHELPSFARIRWQASDHLDGRRAALWQPPKLEPERDLSFLQYTSGSTSAPKGVMVSHRNLMANLPMLGAISSPPGADLSSWNVISWLPQFHDMGLIGVVLYGLYFGATTRLMSPMSFLKRPIRWLQAIAAQSNVISGGPNFAYDLCLRRIKDEELEGLDLSSWNTAFCGSETVRPQTMQRFAARFAGCGLRRSALLPCYGLAETTLGVSGHHGQPEPSLRVDKAALERGQARVRASEATPEVLDVSSCGRLAPNCEVAIVDPRSCERLAAGEVGEVWIRGPHVAQGYWNDPERSATAFGAQIDNEPAQPPYLRSGDLGFLHGEQLYITGRIKEIILVRGRCIYPQDLELAVDSLAGEFPELAVNDSFAFMLPGEVREGVGLILKINRRRNPKYDAGELVEAIQRVVGERFELTFSHIALVRSSPPKTSSGKKMRAACRKLMQDAALEQLELEHMYTREADASSAAPLPKAVPDTAATSRRQAELDAIVLDWLAAETGHPRAGLSSMQPLAELALDSLAAVNLLDLLERELDTSLESTVLEQARTVDELTARLLKLEPTPSVISRSA